MKKILLTSGYMHFLKRNTYLLTKRGFAIYAAASGAEALRMHEELKFDLIISDFKLEDMGGCKFCSLVREKEHSLHVPIILTCHNFPGRVDKVELSGANIIMLKPLEPIRLMNTIGSFLGLQVGRSKRVVLEVAVLGKSGDVQFLCSSHDISNTGILIETKQQLDPGSRIVCKFSLPGICQIITKGEVTRCMNAFGGDVLYGIKFVAMPLSHRKAIDSYIDSIPNPGASTRSIISTNLAKPIRVNHAAYSAR